MSAMLSPLSTTRLLTSYRGARSTTRLPQVSSRTQAHLPHHRLYITVDDAALATTRRHHRHARLVQSEPSAALMPAAVQRLAAWLSSGQWQQDLAASGSLLQQSMQSRLQALCMVLASTYTQACTVWQYVLTCWPAWRASLQEDAEVVFEYVLGVMPAWLAAARAGVDRLARAAAASDAVQQLATSAATVAHSASHGVRTLQQAAQDQLQAVASYRLGPLPLPPLLQQQSWSDAPQLAATAAAGSSSRAKAEVAARLACSLFWFTGSPGTSLEQQQLAGAGAQVYAQTDALIQSGAPKRWRAPHRRGWVDKVAARALRYRDAASSSRSRGREGHWRMPRYKQQPQLQQQHGMGAPEVLHAAQRHLSEQLSALAAGSRAAAGAGVQGFRAVLVAPLQAVGPGPAQAPSFVAAAAAASLLAAAMVQGVMHQREAADQQQQLSQLAAQKAEALRRQKARIMGALQASQAADAAGPGGRRRAAALQQAPDATDAAAAALAVEEDDAADMSAASGPSSSGLSSGPALDKEAAALWRQFLAGSRATDVPMWDNHMADSLPKVSKSEVERQTRKIRAVVASEDAAALEAADMQQLNLQLQALTEAPMGRAARAAWLKEQQQQQTASQQEQQQRGGSSAKAEGGNFSSGSSCGSGVSDNPFVISPEARARWDADDDSTEHAGGGAFRGSPSLLAPAAAVAMPTAGAGAAPATAKGGGQPGSSGAGSHPSSKRSSSPDGSSKRGGSPTMSSKRGGSPSGNPFEITGELRAKWDEEDHLYTDATPRPVSQQGAGAGLLGGLLGLLGGGGGNGAKAAAAAAAAAANSSRRGQPPQRQHRPGGSQAAAAAAPGARERVPPTALQQQQLGGLLGGLSPAESTLEAEQLHRSFEARELPLALPLPLPGAGSSTRSSSATCSAPAANSASGASASTGAVEEGSAEWQALREEVLKSGAARRARRQQWQQQQQQQLTASQPQAAVQSRASTRQPGTSGSSAAAAASMKDAQGVTAVPRIESLLQQKQKEEESSQQQPTTLDNNSGTATNTINADTSAAADAGAALKPGQEADRDEYNSKKAKSGAQR